MRHITTGLIVATALSLSAATSHAGGLKPGYQAHNQLVFGNGWALYDAGCAVWMPFVRSWYNTCGPVVPLPRRVVVVAKY